MFLKIIYDMTAIKKIDFKDARKLTPAEMNALHIETGEHSDAVSKER